MGSGNSEYLYLILLLLLMNCLVGGQLNNTEIVEIRDLHNQYREDVVPPASGMPGLTWSELLAESAQEYADQCLLEDPSETDPKYSDFGVNTGFFEETNEDRDFKRIISVWNEQGNSYDYSLNKCETAQNCDDYIQLVNEVSTRVGCGFKACGSSTPRSNFLVCLYSAKPNLDLRPYITGRDCSTCPEERPICYNSLCYDEGFTSTTTTSTTSTSTSTTSTSTSTTSTTTSLTTSTTSTTTTTTPTPSSTTTETTVTPSTPTPTTTGTPCTTSWKPHFPCLYDCFKSYAVTAEYSLLSCSLLVLTSISFKIFYE